MKTHTYPNFIQEDFYPNAVVLFIAAAEVNGQISNPASIANTLHSEECFAYVVSVEESELLQVRAFLTSQQEDSFDNFELPLLMKYRANGSVKWLSGAVLLDKSKRQAFLQSN